jgi:carbon starvation protein
VWIILQPRDFINVQILYAGIVLLVSSLFIAGFSGMPLNMPRFNLAEGTAQLGFIFPIMFVTIACGAISGFHSLVAGGTTGKQLINERDARRIGFNAMLLESLLAVCVLLTIAVGLQYADFMTVVFPVEVSAKSNPILAFSLSVGHLCHAALRLPVDLGTVFGILLVEGFVITTLDAAVRFNRYLFEELWNILFKNPPAFLKHYVFNSLLSVLLMWIFAYTNAFTKIWPIFGTGNQLLAALGLFTIAAWLMKHGRRYFFAIVPALFMMVTTLASLVILLLKYCRESSYLLAVVAVILLILSLGVIALSIREFRGRRAE